MKFMSPRTESCTQIFQNKTFIVEVFICLLFSFWCQSCSSADWGWCPPPSPHHHLPKWGVANAFYQGLGSPWTLPFQYSETIQLSSLLTVFHFAVLISVKNDSHPLLPRFTVQSPCSFSLLAVKFCFLSAPFLFLGGGRKGMVMSPPLPRVQLTECIVY